MHRVRARALVLVSMVVLGGWVSGCARRPAIPPTVTPPPGPARAGYDGSSGYRPDLDLSPLRGRRVVLDPGHGGRWSGALGVEGTREADVNLRVAQVLDTLLRAAGADVWLTRQSDTSLVVPPDTSLATDLRARAMFADSMNADVFLSIHHNADAGGRHDVNETQTYYRTGDDGPSLDLAQQIHRHLVTGLAVGADRLLPGNYAVLRQTHATCAVLGEPAYLTFPPTEKKLADPQSIRLEAESYFMGLLDYFRSGVPQVLALNWDSTWTGALAYRPIWARVSGVPEGIWFSVDGQLAPAARVTREREPGADTWVLRTAPETPWRDGPHAVSLQVRNPAGNHSRPFLDTLEVRVPATRLVIAAWPESLVATTTSLAARALDEWGRTVADTLAADSVNWSFERLSSKGTARRGAGEGLAWQAARGPALAGEARNYLVSGTKPVGGPIRVTARWRGHSAVATLEPPEQSRESRGWASGFVTRTDNGTPIAGAQVSAPGATAALTNVDGYFALPAGENARLEVAASGFHDPGPSGRDVHQLAPIARGALLGRRIALDPEGGGDETGGSGPTGVRGAIVNLSVARLTREYLERAGALVVLARESDSPVSSLARVQAAERFRAERYVRIGRRVGGPTAAGYYPSSAAGRILAQRLHRRVWAAERADTLIPPYPRRPPVIVEDANYVLQQTSSPAVSIHFGDLASPDDEARFLDPAWRHREASIIYLALAEDLGTGIESMATVTLRLTEGGAPRSETPLWLDGFAALTDEHGEASFGALDPRVRHRLEVVWGGTRGFAEGWIDPSRSSRWEWAASDPSPLPSSRR